MTIFSNNSESNQKLGQTAQILEHLEILLAMQEEQGQQNPDDLNQLLDKTADQISNSLDSQIGKRFEDLEARIQKMSELICEQNLLLESSDKSSCPSTASGEMSNEQQVNLEDVMNQLAEQYGEKTKLIADAFNSKIESLFADLGSHVAKISESVSQQESFAGLQNLMEQSPRVEPLLDTTTDSASHWHQQKEAMLSKYGIDPEYRPMMDLDDSTEQNAESEPENETAELAKDSMSQTDADEIKKIKDQLNEKLREAEVELSINRAKLSQQQAEMESAQVELDRRATAIEEKYAAVKKAPKRRVGFLERLTRHLGQKKPE